MTKALSTRELLRGEHRLQIGPGRGRWRSALILLLLLAFLGLAFSQHDEQLRRLNVLAVENQQLKARLAQFDMQQREAEGTQQQLVRRNGELAAQVKKLKTDLAFFRKQQER